MRTRSTRQLRINWSAQVRRALKVITLNGVIVLQVVRVCQAGETGGNISSCYSTGGSKKDGSVLPRGIRKGGRHPAHFGGRLMQRS